MSEPAQHEELTLARLLRDATAGDAATDDLDRMVRGGVARGRARRRRRTLRSTLAAVSVVGVVGAAAGVLVAGDDSRGDGAGFASDPASPSTSPLPSDPPTEPPAPRPQRIAVRAAQIPALVTAVVPGEVVEFRPAGGYIDQGTTQVAHFQLDGYLVSAGITPAAGDPLQRCRESYPGRPSPCTQRPDGSVLGHGTDAGPAVDGGVASRGTSLFLARFDVFVMSYNAAEPKDAAVISPEPPLSFADLDAIATGGGWVTGS